MKSCKSTYTKELVESPVSNPSFEEMFFQLVFHQTRWKWRKAPRAQKWNFLANLTTGGVSASWRHAEALKKCRSKEFIFLPNVCDDTERVCVGACMKVCVLMQVCQCVCSRERKSERGKLKFCLWHPVNWGSQICLVAAPVPPCFPKACHK